MTAPPIVTTEASFVETASHAPSGVRIPVEVRLSVPDPFEAYRRARRRDADGFFLETTGGQRGWGYFGVDPIERVTVSSDTQSLDRGGDGHGHGGPGRESNGPSLDALDSLLDRERLVRGECDVPYPCGAFGWLSYDVARELEEIPENTVPDGLPRLQLGVFDRVAAWERTGDPDRSADVERVGDDTGDDHDSAVRLRVTACPVVRNSPGDAYEEGCARAMALAEAARDGDPGVAAPRATGGTATFESECGEDGFVERVETIQRSVRDGNTFQTNVSHRLVADAPVHPVDVYDAVRRVNPAPYSGLLEFPGVDLVSASPELLLAVDGDRLRTEPIAGTRPRGETPAEDAALERDLLSDEKERAEHAMLVDLERNDLGKVCEYGTVEVSEYRRVDRYSEVMHLVSLVEGRARDDVSVGDAVAAVFPGGTITGAPKPKTMAIIDEVETTRRGPYTGSVGIFGFDDRATLNITIRTLVRRDGQYCLRVGSGIVHDSVPEAEYEETLNKARALVVAVDEALGDRGSFAVESAPDPVEEVR